MKVRDGKTCKQEYDMDIATDMNLWKKMYVQ